MIGDRVKGFEFAEQRRALFVAMTTPMYNLIGVDGTIVEIDDEYLAILREDKLKELGIR